MMRNIHIMVTLIGDDDTMRSEWTTSLKSTYNVDENTLRYSHKMYTHPIVQPFLNYVQRL